MQRPDAEDATQDTKNEYLLNTEYYSSEQGKNIYFCDLDSEMTCLLVHMVYLKIKTSSQDLSVLWLKKAFEVTSINGGLCAAFKTSVVSGIGQSNEVWFHRNEFLAFLPW